MDLQLPHRQVRAARRVVTDVAADRSGSSDHRGRAGAFSGRRERPRRRSSSTRPYRPDGWTVRQVVHHVADSHMNSFIRFRLALTEDEPHGQTLR